LKWRSQEIDSFTVCNPIGYNRGMEREKRLMMRLIRLALEEDRAAADVTTGALARYDGPTKARVFAKAAGVISGTVPFTAVFHAVDRRTRIEILKGDGEGVQPGETIVRIAGSESSILRAERTALNFLQHLSGIATRTRQFVDALSDLPVKLLDTRKTTPGMRCLEKKAVRDGGGSNHRANLEEMALIKENHIAMAGGIGPAVEAVRAFAPGIPLEVEVRDLKELAEALALQVGWIMLDNFSAEQVREAVKINRGRAKLEVSGNVGIENLHQNGKLGVDLISSGALTHSAPALDVSLLIERE